MDVLSRSAERLLNPLQRSHMEIRILDRAVRFARADIVCLVQDDGVAPREIRLAGICAWTVPNHPRLAILGGRSRGSTLITREASVSGGDGVRFAITLSGPYFIRKQAMRPWRLGILILRGQLSQASVVTRAVPPGLDEQLPGRLQLRPVQRPFGTLSGRRRDSVLRRHQGEEFRSVTPARYLKCTGHTRRIDDSWPARISLGPNLS